VKRTGRDEPVWVAREAMLGISLYRYLYLKLAKCYIFLIISYAFSSTNSETKRANRFCLEAGSGMWGGGGPNNVYICE
jgi:hypothetical protein